jgi:nucleoside 2-deoxyribosyltransferase
LIYLASPYSHPDAAVMESRFDSICRIAGQLMQAGHVVFSPIAHTHPIAVRCELPRSWDYWEKFDREHITRCDKITVVMLDGWSTSRGIKAEIDIAMELGKPIEYFDISSVYLP